MAFQKAKALKEAEKSVAQGKITQAIRLYQTILDNDPSDLSILNTVGDLFIRDRNITEGLRQFHRLAETYVREGFNVKAIAIYRKISKVDPNSIETQLRLADLYQLQGLSREAREQYLQAAESFRKRNQSDRVLEVLHKLAQLDPESVNFRQRIGAELERIGKLQDAASAYLEAAEISLRRDDWAAADPSLKKAAELDPKNSKVSFQLARLAMSQHQPEEAARIINSTPALQNDIAGKRLLLESHLALRKTNEAAELALEVFHANSAEVAAVFNVSWLLAERGDVNDAFKLLATVAESQIAQNHAGPFLESLRRILTLAPSHIPTLELMQSVCERTSDESMLAEVLEALGRAYEQAGNLEKAESAYAKLVERESDNEKLVKLLNAVQQKLGREITPVDFSATQVAMVDEEDVTPEPIVIDAEQEVMVREALENSDLFSRYNLAEKAIAELEKVLQVYPDQTEIHRRILEISRKGFPQRGAVAAAELARIFRKHGDLDLAGKYDELATATGSTADLSMPPAAIAAESPPAPSSLPPDGSEPGAAPEFPLTAVAPEDSHSETAAVSAPIDAPWEARGTESANVQQPTQISAQQTLELDLSDDLDAMIGAGDAVSVQPATAPLETDEWPMPMEIAEPREELALPPHVEMILPASETAEPVRAASPSPPDTGATPAELEDSRIEVEFYLENGFFDEARQSLAALNLKYPGSSFVAGLQHQLDERVGLASPADLSVAEPSSPESPVTSAPAMTGQNMLDDLAGDLGSSLDALTAPPPAGADSPAEASGSKTPVPFTGFSQLSGLLSEIEDAGPAANQDDPETHYNLGVAFREMGLLDESIGEFQKVVRGAGKGIYPPNFLQACSLLAICFMEKKMPALAVRWYKRALETPDLDEEALMALQYDLGVAYELSADFRSALERFTEVYSQNIDFRDVAEKIRELQQKV